MRMSCVCVYIYICMCVAGVLYCEGTVVNQSENRIPGGHACMHVCIYVCKLHHDNMTSASIYRNLVHMLLGDTQHAHIYTQTQTQMHAC